jgi:hypothetical protein
LMRSRVLHMSLPRFTPVGIDFSGEGQIPVQQFKLAKGGVRGASFFEVVFLVDGTKYRYGFEATEEEIVSEWLFCVPSTKEARLFVRKRNAFKLSQRFKEGKGLEEKTRKNVLFLTVASSFNGGTSDKITKWFQQTIVARGLDDPLMRDLTLANFDGARPGVLELVRKLDLGISDIELGPEKELAASVSDLADVGKLVVKKPEIRTIHRIPGRKGRISSSAIFGMDTEESEGTRKLFDLAGPIIIALSVGGVLVVDELDSRLHAMATRTIVSLFNSTQFNPKNAQLIITTHDTNLLSNKTLRRDQIWFVEKNKEGATDLYSLAEFKVRNDASFEKDYIQGRYGAIPFIGDIRHLTANKNA